MQNPFHRHSWDVTLYIYSKMSHSVRKCRNCPVVQSKVRDVNTGKVWWIDGDIWSRNDAIYVLCENSSQFKSCYVSLRQMGIASKIYEITSAERLYGLRNDLAIVFYGRWWEREDILADPRFTELLNATL